MRIFIIACLLFLVFPAYAADMSVEQAYKALNHKQTTFNKNRASMNETESKYLDHLFFVSDLAFRERMVMLKYFKSKKDDQYIDEYNKQVGDLLASFALIKAPNRNLQQIEILLKGAITEQKQFFNEWNKARGNSHYDQLQRNYSSHKLVQSSHNKLVQTYMMLKRSYPRESAHNQQSFYDHMCALDFL